MHEQNVRIGAIGVCVLIGLRILNSIIPFRAVRAGTAAEGGSS